MGKEMRYVTILEQLKLEEELNDEISNYDDNNRDELVKGLEDFFSTQHRIDDEVFKKIIQLIIVLKKRNNKTKLNEYINYINKNFDDAFKTYPILYHIISTALNANPSFAEIKQGIQFENKFIDICIKNDILLKPRIVNNLGSLLSKGLEIDSKDELLNKYINSTLVYIDDALLLNKTYAKLYLTKAKLLTFLHKYKEAEIAMKNAISEETSSARRLEYQIQKEKLLLIKGYHTFESKHIKLKQELENAKKENFQNLSIFMAIISLIFSGITFAAAFKSSFDAVSVIFFNTISIAFIISILLKNDKKTSVGIAIFSLVYFIFLYFLK